MEHIVSFLEKWDVLGLVFAATISLIVGLIYTGIRNLVVMKRKPYNISRQIITRTVYDNRKEGDLAIIVSYKGQLYDDSLTMARLRLLNDGENDILFTYHCSSPIMVEIKDASIIDLIAEPSNAAVKPSLKQLRNNQYALSWDLLKKDEYLDLVVVTKGRDFLAEQIDIVMRAKGIDKIKSPEYRVWPQLWPILIADLLMVAAAWFGMSSRPSVIIPSVPENVFWSAFALFMLPLYIILVLIKRIKWLKE